MVYQEEARVDKKHTYLLCDMIGDKSVDTADICKTILKKPKRGTSVPANKARAEKIIVFDHSLSRDCCNAWR